MAFAEFDKYEDTTLAYDRPEDWIADGVGAFIDMLLLNVPKPVKVSDDEVHKTAVSVLKNVYEMAKLVNEGKMTHTHKETVTNLYSWILEAIMDFLYDNRGFDVKVIGCKKWTQKEVRDAMPKGVKKVLARVQ